MNVLAEVLPLDHPEIYSCRLYGYIHSHQQLWIEVSSEKETFYLFFQAVFFFSGATGWLGADFVLESPETCLNFLQSSGLYERFDGVSDDELRKLLRLYGIRGSHPEINILTSSYAYIHDKAPLWTMLSDSEAEG